MSSIRHHNSPPDSLLNHTCFFMHIRIHPISRRPYDTPNPKGEIRGLIPDKMEY